MSKGVLIFIIIVAILLFSELNKKRTGRVVRFPGDIIVDGIVKLVKKIRRRKDV